MFCPKCGKETSGEAQFCQHCGANTQVTELGVKPKRSPAVIVLIIVGVIFGFIIISIIAAIAIPSFLSAKQRSIERQAMADLRSLGLAVETYWVDFDTYPICNDIDELAELLTPNYMRDVPTVDGWGNPFLYEVRNDGEDCCLISRGRDGIQDKFIPDPFDINSFYDQRFDSFYNDIVFCNGQFIYWPQ